MATLVFLKIQLKYGTGTKRRCNVCRVIHPDTTFVTNNTIKKRWKGGGVSCSIGCMTTTRDSFLYRATHTRCTGEGLRRLVAILAAKRDASQLSCTSWLNTVPIKNARLHLSILTMENCLCEILVGYQSTIGSSIIMFLNFNMSVHGTRRSQGK